MELLGDILLKIVEEWKVLNLESICWIFQQIAERLRVFHSKNYIHRDIKPENMVLGLKKKDKIVYLIDYGLATEYRY